MEDYASALASGQDRFLSSCLNYALKNQWLGFDELLAQFPPAEIMRALEGALSLRNRVLIEVVGVHEKIAPKKSTGAATEDLSIALTEGVTTSQQLFEVLGPDECVRHLSHQSLWRLLTSSQFWQRSDAEARARVEFLLDRAELEGLITSASMLQQIGLGRLAEELPKSDLENAFAKAVELGIAGVPFTPEVLAETVPKSVWLGHVPLAHVFEQVIQSTVVAALGLSERPPAPSTRELASDQEHSAAVPRAGATPDPNSDSIGESELKSGLRAFEAPPSGPMAAGSLGSSQSEPATERLSIVEDASDEARTRALENLRLLGRLPRHPEQCSTPLLLGLDAMCSELRGLHTDEDRETCIRDAFPNEALLREALLSLAEVMDPRLDREKLEHQGADLDALIQIVLFEENRASRLSSHPSHPVTEAETLPTPDVKVMVSPPPLPPTRSMPAPPPLPPLSRGRSPKTR